MSDLPDLDQPAPDYGWAIPFPLEAREITVRSFPVVHISFELIEQLCVEEVVTWLQLSVWKQRGEESSVQRLADEVWYGQIWRAEQWIGSLAAKGLIVGGEEYLYRNRVLTAASEPAVSSRVDRHEPDAEGMWSGPWPLAYETNYPPRQQSVVYALFDSDDLVVYVGSSENFRERLKQHRKDGKIFSSWTAHPCETRDEAYRVEAEFLQGHMPILNRQGPQRRFTVGGAA